MKKENWYHIKDTEQLISPSLLVFPDRIEKNIGTMLKIAGGPQRLRPHIKTHKIAEIIEMQLRHGIHKFKCATIAEAELLATTGARDVLLAIQPSGPNITRFFDLMDTYPETHFSTIVDNAKTMDEVAKIAPMKHTVVSLFLDINSGMNRTGIAPGPEAVELYRRIVDHPNLEVKGLHAYDGHIRNPDIAVRTKVCDAAFELVSQLKRDIEDLGMPVNTIVAGGTPSFPIHSRRGTVEVSPGTSLLWDHRYGTLFPEMEFVPAAVLLSRIISKPKEGYLCLDLGHKSVAPEMPLPRVRFLGDVDFEQVGQSEEHLVVTTQKSSAYEVGDILYAVPFHICPTVAKYHEVISIATNGEQEIWSVAARNNKITI